MATQSKLKWFKRNRVSAIVLVLSIIAIMGAVFRESSTTTQNQGQTSIQSSGQEIQPKSAQSLSDKPIDRIKTLAKNVYDKFEVSLYSRDFNEANAKNGPYNVILDTPSKALNDCNHAKDLTLQVLKVVYTDSIAQDNVMRVRINALPYASASLGSNDGQSVSDNDWRSISPTDFIAVLTQFGTQEKEDTPLEKQTYWLERTGCAG